MQLVACVQQRPRVRTFTAGRIWKAADLERHGGAWLCSATYA